MNDAAAETVARFLHQALLRRLELPIETQVLIRSSSWASVTFEGARHCFDIICTPTAALTQKLGLLKEEEFDLPHLLVADIDARWENRPNKALVQIEILTVSTG
jgi:hypothetical protein